MSVIITPGEVYDTYVEIDNNMLLDVEIYNSLIQKAKMQNQSITIFLFFFLLIFVSIFCCVMKYSILNCTSFLNSVTEVFGRP